MDQGEARPRNPRRSALGRLGLASITTLCALSACGELPPPSPPPVSTIPAYPGPTSRVHTARKPLSAFARLRDRILNRWLADEPSLGRSAGLHQYDGRVADYSAAGISGRLARVEKERAELAAVDRRKLTPDEALDLALLLQKADMTLFQGRDLDVYRRNPQTYEELFSVDDYLKRDYAPVAERAEHLLAHEEAALAQVANVDKNLASPLSRPIAETSAKIYKGYADYLRNDVPKQLDGTVSPALRQRLAKANEALAAAATAIAERLAREAKKGDNSHVLGPERYRKLLEVQEGLTIPLAELEKMGEDNLAENKKAYEALVRKRVKLIPTKQADLFHDAEQLTAAARRFIVDKKLVTIPTTEQAVVKETPPFMRWNAAFLDWPGVFEKKALPGLFYITLPDPSWTKKEQEDYLTPHGILLSTTIHEVYPGHFLQGQWLKRAPTRAQKILTSYSFVEGWAHYGEQMMIEQGFAGEGGNADEARLGQLSDALLRNCRVLVSLGLHTKHMTLAQAERRFIQDCHQDKATAREQAARGAFDPGYFAYTLGKMQILALRDEARKRLGPRFSLQRFHDALLSHGAPPVPLIRERVLHDLGADTAKGAP